MRKLVFGVLMAMMMVYGMEVYNAALRLGGFDAEMLLPSWQVVILVPLVMVLQNFYGGPLAGRLANALLGGREVSPQGEQLARQLCTVLFMCPAMSMAAVFMFKGGWQPGFFGVWERTVLLNAPMALFWQIFVAMPVVRFIVSNIYNRRNAIKAE